MNKITEPTTTKEAVMIIHHEINGKGGLVDKVDALNNKLDKFIENREETCPFKRKNDNKWINRKRIAFVVTGTIATFSFVISIIALFVN